MAFNILEHNYLTIALPDGWEDASQVIALGPEDGGFRPNFIFSQEPAPADEDATGFAARQLGPLKEALEGYVLVHEGKATFGLNSGFLREQCFSMDKGDIGQLQFYQIINGRAYTFTFTHLKERLADVKSLAEQLFATARLMPPGGSPAEHADNLDF